jgi:uncharacterized membrane protein
LVEDAKVAEFQDRLKHLEGWVMTTNLSDEKEKALRKLMEK